MTRSELTLAKRDGEARLPDLVAQQLTGLIENGTLGPGDRLPAEGALARRFGVSKPVVREALRQLSALGVISRHQGRVATVEPLSARSFQTCFRFAVGGSKQRLLEAVQLRRALEEHAVAMAAARISDEGVARLKFALGVMEAARDLPEEWMRADFRFHMLIFEAAENELIGRVLEGLRGSIEDTVRAVYLSQKAPDTRGSLRRHKAIFDAVSARDPERARRAMGRHFDSNERVLRSQLGVKAEAPARRP